MDRVTAGEAREARVKAALDAVREGCDVAARRAADPVGFVHRFADPHDRELVALAASSIAFGNVKTIRAKLGELLVRLGPRPAHVADARPELLRRLRGWKSRVFRGEDIAHLLAGGRAIQNDHGSIGAYFEAQLARSGPGSEGMREALGALCDAIRKAGGLRKGGPRRGPSHLLPDPRGASGCKRLLLFLRWMARPADGIDLGMWNVDRSRLLVPVDVHIHRLAQNLGFTRRSGTSWQTTEEITSALARLDGADPTRYDFSLCHMGMLRRCPSRRAPALCEGCGVKPVCIRWDASSGRGPGKTTSRAARRGRAR